MCPAPNPELLSSCHQCILASALPWCYTILFHFHFHFLNQNLVRRFKGLGRPPLPSPSGIELCWRKGNGSDWAQNANPFWCQTRLTGEEEIKSSYVVTVPSPKWLKSQSQAIAWLPQIWFKNWNRMLKAYNVIGQKILVLVFIACPGAWSMQPNAGLAKSGNKT